MLLLKIYLINPPNLWTNFQDNIHPQAVSMKNPFMIWFLLTSPASVMVSCPTHANSY